MKHLNDLLMMMEKLTFKSGLNDGIFLIERNDKEFHPFYNTRKNYNKKYKTFDRFNALNYVKLFKQLSDTVSFRNFFGKSVLLMHELKCFLHFEPFASNEYKDLLKTSKNKLSEIIDYLDHYLHIDEAIEDDIEIMVLEGIARQYVNNFGENNYSNSFDSSLKKMFDLEIERKMNGDRENEKFVEERKKSVLLLRSLIDEKELRDFEDFSVDDLDMDVMCNVFITLFLLMVRVILLLTSIDFRTIYRLVHRLIIFEGNDDSGKSHILKEYGYYIGYNKLEREDYEENVKNILITKMHPESLDNISELEYITKFSLNIPNDIRQTLNMMLIIEKEEMNDYKFIEEKDIDNFILQDRSFLSNLVYSSLYKESKENSNNLFKIYMNHLRPHLRTTISYNLELFFDVVMIIIVRNSPFNSDKITDAFNNNALGANIWKNINEKYKELANEYDGSMYVNRDLHINNYHTILLDLKDDYRNSIENPFELIKKIENTIYNYILA